MDFLGFLGLIGLSWISWLSWFFLDSSTLRVKHNLPGKEKNKGLTLDILKKQLNQSLPVTTTDKNTVIAYEPVWAIGSGKTPTITDIKYLYKMLRNHISVITTGDIATKIRIIYGGSVNTKNCTEILNIEDVDGALVGGESLKASSFSKIINSSN